MAFTGWYAKLERRNITAMDIQDYFFINQAAKISTTFW